MTSEYVLVCQMPLGKFYFAGYADEGKAVTWIEDKTKAVKFKSERAAKFEAKFVKVAVEVEVV